MFQYTPNQVGSQIFAEKLSDLTERVPEEWVEVQMNRYKEKPIKITKGKYMYRGYAIENFKNLPPVITETAFVSNRWKLGRKFSVI